MARPDPRSNPDNVPGAPPPRVGRYAVNGTTLYAEVRGTGPVVLLIPGGAEDAEGWRPIAERLAGRTVVTYDRRGTRRSSPQDWPGRGSVQHADDAAALLRALSLNNVTVFGGSSGGVIAVRLAIRHPEILRRALVFEPGYLRCVEAGVSLQKLASGVIADHLAHHPGDWAGAYATLIETIAVTPSDSPGFLEPPVGKEWYARREAGNAEAFVRDDAPILTAETLDESSVRSIRAEVRFSHGTRSPAVFQDVATKLAAMRGEVPDAIEGAGHAIYVVPDLAAAYIHDHST